MNGVDDFFKELSNGQKKTKYFDDIASAYFKIFPEYKNQPNYAKHLLLLIKHLEKNERVTLPVVNGKGWRDGNPRLPNWIKLNREIRANESIIPSKYAWHPKIAPFVDELRNSQKETAFKISEYFKHHSKNGRFNSLIPRRERSLKIFRDEKKLDSLSNKGKLFGGYLTLHDLGCYDVSWPMPFKVPSVNCPGKPFLIIENHHTFESFTRWNETSRLYSGIGYGAGEAFSTLESDRIEDIITPLQVSEILYFGDIDPKGISIPARVNKARVQKELKPILPAVNLYFWLIRNGIERPLGKGKQHEYISGWLPENLEKQISKFFSDSIWFPQEALGADELKLMQY